jgi:hypothetical protein
MQSKIVGVILLLALSLSGCASMKYDPIITADYPSSIKFFDLTLGWKASVAESVMKIDGYARNNRYPVISDLELRIELLDKNHKLKAKQTFFFIPISMPIDSLSSFTVTLAATPLKGDNLRFVYSYKAIEGSGESLYWFNNFEVPALPLP